MTTQVDYVSAVRANEPRIDTVKPEWRDIIAALVFADVPFDAAIAKFQGIIDQTKQEAESAKITQRSMRENTEKSFASTVSEFLKTSALAIPVENRPYLWRITVDYSSPAKNVDGSPKMDAENNPVFDVSVDASATWNKKVSTESADSNTAGTRGRVAYVTLVKSDGSTEKHSSLMDVAEALGQPKGPNARANIQMAGFQISDRQLDSESKSFVTVAKAPTSNGQT